MKLCTSLSFLFLFFLAGCVSLPTKNEMNPSAKPVCLTDCNEVPASIQNFKETRRLETEMDEIEFLMYRIRTSSCKFYRNGAVYEGPSVVQFLRWKILWYQDTFGERIETDEEFVEKILSGSKRSGLPYQIIFPDGKKYNALWIMRNELKRLHEIHPQSDRPNPSAPSVTPR